MRVREAEELSLSRPSDPVFSTHMDRIGEACCCRQCVRPRPMSRMSRMSRKSQNLAVFDWNENWKTMIPAANKEPQTEHTDDDRAFDVHVRRFCGRAAFLRQRRSSNARGSSTYGMGWQGAGFKRSRKGRRAAG